MLDAPSTTCSPAGGDRARDGCAQLPAALARLVVQRLADAAAGQPAPGAAAASRSCSRSATAAPPLDLPHGVGRPRGRGVLRFGRTPALAA